MKYSEILPDVLAGKWVRHKPNHEWFMMSESGIFVKGGKTLVSIDRNSYDLDTWEVKPEIIYVFYDKRGIDSGYIPCEKSEATHKLVPL